MLSGCGPKVEAVETARTVVAGRVRTGPGKGTLVRVLIISEDAAERQRAASALHLRDGIEVTEATSARLGTTILATTSADVLVVDGDLQPKGGFSWLYELRAQGELTGTPRPPAVVLAARAQDQFLADWAGAEAVLPKPVDPFRLLTTVTGLAERPTSGVS
jgi:CheY-like chemotaxis protein